MDVINVDYSTNPDTVHIKLRNTRNYTVALHPFYSLGSKHDLWSLHHSHQPTDWKSSEEIVLQHIKETYTDLTMEGQLTSGEVYAN